MSILERMDVEMKAALKAGDGLRLSTLRMVRSAVGYREIQLGRKLTDAELVEVFASEAKRRREAMSEYEKAGRADLQKKEADELAVLETYLPEPLSDADLDRLVHQAVSSSGAQGPKDMGKVMSALMPLVKGRADGRKVNDRVRAALSA